jgi:hypothetical protein
VEWIPTKKSDIRDMGCFGLREEEGEEGKEGEEDEEEDEEEEEEEEEEGEQLTTHAWYCLSVCVCLCVSVVGLVLPVFLCLCGCECVCVCVCTHTIADLVEMCVSVRGGRGYVLIQIILYDLYLCYFFFAGILMTRKVGCSLSTP